MASRRRRGCESCRKRKKKCDMQIPSCQRCRDDHLPCSGYESNLVWVDTSIQHQKQAASKESLPSRGRARRETKSVESPRDHLKPTRLTLPGTDCLVATAREQLYFGHFWSNFMPLHCKTPSAAAVELSSIGWTALVGQIYGEDRLLRSIVMGLAMAGLAVETGDMQLGTKALQSYNTTVHMIAAALHCQKDHEKDELLLAIRLMALFEVIFAPRNDTRVFVWREHGQGQQAVFLARGPHAFTSGPAHQLFSDHRVNMAFLAIGQKKTSPFSCRDWMTVPWTIRPRTQMDKLVDIMLELPTCLEKLSEMASSRPIQTKHHIASDCQIISASLSVFAKNLGPEIFRYDHHVQGLPLKPPTSDRDFALLHLCQVYWFTRMVTCSIQAFVGDGLEVKEADRDRELYASKSSHALPLLFHTAGGMARNATALLCLGIALRYFVTLEPERQKSRESQVLEEILERKVGGVEVKQVMTSMFGGGDPYVRKSDGDLKAIDRISWF